MKIKKILSLLTGTVMAFTVMYGASVKQTKKTLVQSVTAEAAASDFTAEQAVAWANNCAATKWDKDVDGAYGTQCVDLILGYYSYLGVSRSRGNATDYQSNTLPSGWTRVKSSPKPGDVIVWAGNTKINSSYTLSQYGHIGIVVAVSGNNLTTVETNADGKVSYAQKLSRDASYAACFIRPNFSGSAHDDCVNVTTGKYYLKNQSTNSYMQAAGASNAAKLSLAAKKETSAFMLNLTGSKSAGYYLATQLDTGYVVNPYSDTPANGTVINIYKKDNSGTQLWEFDKSGNGYIIHLKNNSNLCLTADGTGAVLKTRTGAANQIWILESEHNCEDIKTGNYYLKNTSTDSYMQAAGASNAAKLSLASKKETSAFLLNLTGSKSAGYYLATQLDTGYVVNPYSDTPANGTVINIYKKDNSGTQLWEFDKSGNGYIIHLKNNSNLCITADGTGAVLKTRTGATNQIWILESENSVTTTTTTQTTTTATTTTTTATVPSSEFSIGISELTLLVGEQYAIKANQDNLTYKSSNTDIAVVNKSGVITTVSKGNAVITVYNADGDAVQLKLTVTDNIKGDANDDNKLTIADAIMLQKWLLGSGELAIWQNADLCEDGVIDIFDMIEMRKLLIESNNLSAQ
ncbi:MAG: RICIN domain-containing protein [Ruminococcus sp.]|nr:RICIN domain-containing protein [Ruminococcus sp.]